MANHVAGSICEQFERDSERAKKYYQVAGEQGAYGAFMDLYRLKYNEVIIVSYTFISPFPLHTQSYTSFTCMTEKDGLTGHSVYHGAHYLQMPVLNH
jgi:hypothetical protein